MSNFLQELLKRKPIQHKSLSAPTSPARVLGFWDLLFYGLGSTLVGGFMLTGEIVADYAGPAAMFSYLIAGIACLLTCFCYCEFACRVPVSGTAYSYTYVTIGEFLAWIIGWDLTLEYAIGAASVARIWSEYFVEMMADVFSVEVSDWLYDWGDSSYSPISSMVVIVLSFVMAAGVKESTTFNFCLVLISVSALLFFIIFG
jgi:APA family basic amino acid/polyamine antiporter